MQVGLDFRAMKKSLTVQYCCIQMQLHQMKNTQIASIN